jgi:peptidylprolyl isomerase
VAPAIGLSIGMAITAGCGNNTRGSEPDVAFTVPGKTVTTAGPVVCEPPAGTPPTLGQKPVLTQQTGAPPTTLVCKDLVIGTGAEAKPGDTVKVEYVGALFKDNTEFDTSWGKQPFEFELGAGNVIQGWDLGVANMKVGGRRELIIPGDLAYGSRGSPPKIGPNETLVFVVDLLEVIPPASTSTVPGASLTVPPVTTPVPGAPSTPVPPSTASTLAPATTASTLAPTTTIASIVPPTSG